MERGAYPAQRLSSIRAYGDIGRRLFNICHVSTGAALTLKQGWEKKSDQTLEIIRTTLEGTLNEGRQGLCGYLPATI